MAFFYHYRRADRAGEQILATENLLYLWIAFFLIKTCHEFGHAYAARHYGAEVHRMGVMFLIFMPCWYVDTTPVWAFPREVAQDRGGHGRDADRALHRLAGAVRLALAGTGRPAHRSSTT